MPVSITLLPQTGLLTIQQAAHTAITTLNTTVTTVPLYPHGCDFADSSGHFTPNCTAACQQPAAVWDSMFTLHNCLSYPAVATLLDEEGGLSERDEEVVRGMGFLGRGDEGLNLTSVVVPIDACMHGFCREITSSGECYAHEVHQFDADKFVKGACGYFKASPNTDVGGVGVYVGYLMQLSILIYAYIHTRLLATWIRYATILIYTPIRGLKRARLAAANIQARLKTTHQQAALISGLVEFQRAQAFYSITLQSAAIASLSGSGSVFDVDSYQQMHLTVGLLGDVAATGIVCIAFGLYILHGWNKRSWYTTVLSAVAILVSFAAWVQTRLPLNNLRQLSPVEHNLPSCGGRSPATFCLTPQTHPNTTLEATLITLSLLTIILLSTRQYHAYHTRTPTKQFPWRLELAEACFAAITVLMIYILVSNGEMAAMRQGVQWTFAQLISVTIWAPCIVEYLYAAVRKWSLGAGREVQELFADEDSDAED